MKNLVLWLLAIPLLCGCHRADVTGTNYYFDSENGNDFNNGLSPETAWKSVEKMQEIALQPGDNILFRRGGTFTGVMEISGKGHHDAHIVVDAYGTGNKPCISAPDGSLYAVRIRNSEYLTLQNLEIVNHGSDTMANRVGLRVCLKT